MGVALGSLLGGAETGMMDAKKQALAEKTEADQNTIQTGQLGLQQNKFTFEQKQAAAARIDNAVAQIYQSMVNTHDAFTNAGHPPKDFAPAIQALSQHAVDLLNLGGMQDYAKAFQAKADALISLPAADTDPKYVVAGEDTSTGVARKIYAQINANAPGGRTLPQDLRPETTDFLPKDSQGNLIHGQEALDAYRAKDPNGAAIVSQMLRGQIPPPTSFTLGKQPIWRQYLAIAQNIDPHYSGQNYSTIMTTAKEFASTKNNTSGGAINAGQGAMNHLADVADASVKLPNIDSSFPGVAAANNYGRKGIAEATAKTGPYIDYNTAVGKFAPEVTRFYVNLGGTGKEREKEVSELRDTFSRTEQGHALLSNTRLILEKLAPLDKKFHDNVSQFAESPIMTPEMVSSTDKVLTHAVELDPSLADEAKALRDKFFPEKPLQVVNQQGANAVPLAGGMTQDPTRAAPPVGTEAPAPGAPAAPAGAPAAPQQQGAAQPSQQIITQPQSFAEQKQMQADQLRAQSLAFKYPARAAEIYGQLYSTYPILGQQAMQAAQQAQQQAAQAAAVTQAAQKPQRPAAKPAAAPQPQQRVF
jgi:hypothetical protein